MHYQTPATQALDSAALAYELQAVALDLPNPTAQDFANAIRHQHKASLYKTIVLKGDKSGVFVCLVPYEQKINYKRAAQATQNHKCTILPLQDLEPTTGYQRGACSPLGMKSGFPLLVDLSAKACETILINAGAHGLLIRIAPETLATAMPLTWVEGLSMQEN